MTEPSARRRKGQGTVRMKGSTWYACWWVIDGGTGKRAQRSKGGFTSATAAERYLRKVLVSKDDGSHVDVDKKLTVAQLLDAWLRAKRVEGRRASTLAGYEQTIKTWIKPHIGALKVATLTTEQVDEMLAELLSRGGRTSKPLSPRSVQLAGTVLRMALAWGVKRGHLARNVATDAAVPSAQSPTMSCWSSPETARYIATALTDREGALFVLAVLRGMRRGELCGLRWANVDLDAGALQVLETTVLVAGKSTESAPKTAAGKRRVPLDSYLVGVLKDHRRRQLEERMAAGSAWAAGDFVFTDEIGRPLLPDHVSDKHSKLCAAAGLPHIRMHDLRHTCATLLLSNGVPVSTVAAMLGHADAAITLRVYAHVIPGHADAAGEALTRSVMGGI